MSIVQDRLGDHSEARKSAERAEGAARAAGAQDELGTAVLLKGWAACQLGDQKDAIELGEKALELSQNSGNRREMARSLNLLGQANDVLGSYEQARGYKEKALALFQELDDRRWIGTMLNNLANTANYRGEYERAIPLYEEALTILNQVSDSHMVMATLVNLGAARVGAGDYRAAEEDLRQVLELCTDSDWMGLSLTHSWLAEALLGIGEVEEAAVEAQRALEQARVSGRVEDLGVAWRMVGECAWKTSKPIPIDDKPYTPAECFKISLETLTEIDAEPETAWTLRKWAEYEMHSGDFIRGREMWDQAREIFSRLDMPAQVARMDQTLADRG